MRLDLARLPTDPILLHTIVRDLAEVLEHRDAKIDTLRRLVTTLKRRQFGQSSEKQHPDQLALGLEVIEEQIGALEAETPAAASPAAASPTDDAKAPRRKPLPAHLPREEHRHEPKDCACPACGGVLHAIGEDVSEVLHYVPARFKAIRHVRPRVTCRACESIHQMPKQVHVANHSLKSTR